MDDKFCLNQKVYDYTFNFMAMSCLLWLTILWHLFKATRLFELHVSITTTDELQIQLLIFKFR
jgi:hypothetical protein